MIYEELKDYTELIPPYESKSIRAELQHVNKHIRSVIINAQRVWYSFTVVDLKKAVKKTTENGNHDLTSNSKRENELEGCNEESSIKME